MRRLLPGNRGVYRSTNATSANPIVHADWRTSSPNNNFSVRDIVIDPLDPNIMIANLVVNGGIYRSTNALAAPQHLPMYRHLRAPPASDLTRRIPRYTIRLVRTLLFMQELAGGGRLYRSTDGGATWVQQIDITFVPPNAFGARYRHSRGTPQMPIRFMGGSPNLIAGKSTNAGVVYLTTAVAYMLIRMYSQ